MVSGVLIGRLMPPPKRSSGASAFSLYVPETAERVEALYNYRRNRFASRFDGDPDGVEERSANYQRLMVELLVAQRQRLIQLRDEGIIGDDAMHRIERDLDLEESRLEIG